MAPNLRKSEFAEAAMLGFSLSQSAIIDPKELLHKHRQQLRSRFLKGGEHAITDTELLELVIYGAIPHRDVRDVCKALLEKFGSFNGVIAATDANLGKVKGVGLAIINELKVIRVATNKLAQMQILDKDVLTTWDQLISYCTVRMAYLLEEQFRVLFLDCKNVLIADECLQSGTVNHVPVYPRQVAKRALELNASAVILVHNHPSGDPEPSDSDISVTLEIIGALSALSIVVHDHVIISKTGAKSLKSSGLI